MSEQSGPLGFPRSFWTVNVMELFERAAYYGLNSVLAVYLTGSVASGGLGFGEQSVGFLQSLVYACNYVLPILGGALADRYGYRRMLLLAFSVMTVGYFAAGHSSTYAVVFLALLFMAAGGGLFKPIVSGTIARTTTDANSAMGFGIYYMMINIGAFLAPLVVSWLKGFSWQMVFTASAFYCFLMLLPTVFIFRDPPLPENTKRLREVLGGAVEVLADSRFMLMVVVYSGFWILYFQTFGTILWYLRDFVDKTPVNAFMNGLLGHTGLHFSFDAEHVTVINGGIIILLQVLVSRLVKNRPALPTMITGMVFGALGFCLLASSQNGWVFVAGIAVFTLGEMTAHPKYYSFVGLIAPEARKALYMGYSFLYGVFGALLGSSLGAFLYARHLKPYAGLAMAPGAARRFWVLFAVFDLLAAAGLWLFARYYGKDTEGTRKGARRWMIAVYVLILALGIGFATTALRSTPADFRTLIQSLIFLAMGGGGLVVTLRSRRRD
nr:MFS transporter [uncultured Holophaga sp.]